MTFRQLYESHAAHVRRFVLFLGADAALADDLTSDTFVRAWTTSAPIRQDSARAYLFTIARNLFRDARRRARRHSSLDDDLPDTGLPVHQQVEDRSELDTVLRAMRTLPASDRLILLMRAQEQLSHEEMAQALGLSVTAVKVKLHRARQKLMRLTRVEADTGSETP